MFRKQNKDLTSLSDNQLTQIKQINSVLAELKK